MTFCFILKHKITHFTYSHLFSVVLSLAVIHSHSLSFFVTRCHSLSLVVIRCHSLSLVITRCQSLYHSLSLVVIRCHSLYHLLSLFVIRCITRLSFYKRSRSFENCFYLSSCSLPQWWRFWRIIYSNVALNQTLLLQNYRGTSPSIFYVLEAYGTH